jgi:hypothetical protein
MTSIRKFVYAGLLAFTAMNFVPAIASAQEMAHGKFTLKHEVRWENAVVPAGDYRFSVESAGASGLLTLSKVSGASGGFMFLVHDTDEAKPSDMNRLILESTVDGSYVKAMQLPEFGVTLNFTAPTRSAETRTANAPSGTTVAAAR